MTDKKIDRSRLKRGKFPDDKRDEVLTKGRIVKMEPMFPRCGATWQLKLFDRFGNPSENDPRDLAPNCTTAFWNNQSANILAMDKKYKRGKYRHLDVPPNTPHTDTNGGTNPRK